MWSGTGRARPQPSLETAPQSRTCCAAASLPSSASPERRACAQSAGFACGSCSGCNRTGTSVKQLWNAAEMEDQWKVKHGQPDLNLNILLFECPRCWLISMMYINSCIVPLDLHLDHNNLTEACKFF